MRSRTAALLRGGVRSAAPQARGRALATSAASRTPRPINAVTSGGPRSSWTTAPPGASPGAGGTSVSPNEDPSASLGRHFYLNKVLESYAARPATRMTLRQLVFFGRRLGGDRDKILRSANYVRQELPVRLAHRIRDLQALPFVVMTNKHLGEVYNKYWHAFETFRRFPQIRSMEDNEAFCATLKAALDDHLTIIPSLTIGIVEASAHLPPDRLDRFMERMLRSRIARRVLAEQHIALSEALDDPFHFFNDVAADSSSADAPAAAGGPGEHVGIIYTQLCVSEVVRKGVRLLREMFAREMGLMPNDEWIPTVAIDGDLEARFAYIPEHLEYIIFELLKNAMSAVMRRPMEERDVIPIRVTIVEGPPDEDLIVRISDCGGGLPDLVEEITSRQESMMALPPKAAAHAHPLLAAVAEGRDPPRYTDDELPASSLNLGGSSSQRQGSSSPSSSLPQRSRASSSPRERKADATAGDQALIDVLTSFSSVRRRLELEDEMRQRRQRHEKQPPTLGLATSEKFRITDTGIGSQERLDALRSVRHFKGTVAEQLSVATSAAVDATSIGTQASERIAEKQQQPAWVPRGDDGTPAHASRPETGLGLPMTRIYTEFLGGRLSLRSVDGGGLDVYLRLQKLGDEKERIDDIEM